MIKEYEIKYDGAVVGRVKVAESGLYYSIYADTSLPAEDFFRLKILCGFQETDLGLLVPDKQKYVLNKRIPRKMIDLNTCRFIIKNHREKTSVIESLPKPVVAELHRYKLVKTNEGMFLEFINQSPDPPDSGRIPIYPHK